MEIVNQLRLTGVTDRFFTDTKKKKAKTYGFLRVKGIEKDVYLDFSLCKKETKMFPHPGDLIDFSLDFSQIGPIATFWWFINPPSTEYRILEKRSSGEWKIISSGRLEDLVFPEDLNDIKFSKRGWIIPTTWEDCPDPRIELKPETEVVNQNFSHNFFHRLNESLCG